MKQIILHREDINNPLHPWMWEQLCEELELSTDSDEITLFVTNAKSDAMEDL